MTTATVSLPSAPHLTGGGILRSEWIKLRSLRSTVWSYATIVIISIGLAVLMSTTLNFEGTGALPDADQRSLATQAATFGVLFGQMIVAVLGVLVISGEYSTGMIRSTLTAVPTRLPALWAKAIVLFVATFVVGAVATIASFLIAAPILDGKGVSVSLFDPGVLPALFGGALYLALVAVFALGLGSMLRSSAGGIAATLGILLILQVVLSMIPAQWAQDLMPYLISQAGGTLFNLPGSGAPAPDVVRDLLIVLAWVAASLAGAALLLKRRDA